MTDASDYGLGGYLYQVVDGKETPIQFISKTFDETQLKWSTNEKEAYAIIYAIRKLDPLLRDIFFTLKTDHKNLIYICDHASAKVGRWKMDLQEYNFDVEHVPGVENVVADSCSRLLALTDSNEKREGYKRFAVPPSHALAYLAVLAEPDNHQLSPFVTPLWLHEALGTIHGTYTGHWGVDLLYKKAKEIFDAQGKKVPNLKAHCRQFVRKCPCCQKMSQLRTPILAQKFTLSTYAPMERVYTDSIGPLPADEQGNKYILVIIDAFTRWIELYAIPDTTAEIAARCLLDWTGRFGTPIQIMSDGGTQYVNELWEAYCELLGIQKLESFPYSHEENGIVERANKEVMRHLRAIVFDKKLQTKEWSTYLPLVQRIMDGHPVGTTGISPAQLLFGNAVSLNERILPAPNDGSVIARTLTAATSDMLTWQSHLVQKHEELLRSHDAQHVATPFDTRKKVASFPEGSYVLVEYDNTAVKGRGPPNKLMPFLRGPYRVINNVGSRYTLLDLITNKHTDVLFHRLHPFFYDKARMDPKEAACRDREEYEVEKILGHSGDPRKKSEMKFFVKWKGYDDPKENTWEPWKTLRLVDKLHEYLLENNMSNLIPRDCRGEQSPEPSRRAKKHVHFNEDDNEVYAPESRETSPTRRSNRLNNNLT
jgi:transposase InsO family protein